MNNFETEELSRALGRRIKKIRERKGLTQKELAENTGYTNRSYIANIERGSQNPSLDSINRIAETLEVPVGRLFYNIEEDARDLGENIDQIKTWWNSLIEEGPFEFNFYNQLIIEKFELPEKISGDKIAPLSRAELEEKRQENSFFLETANAYMIYISSALDIKPHLIAVSDEEGWLLNLIRNGDFLNNYVVGNSEFEVKPGINLSREYVGDNGLGTALELKKPVLLYGCDHIDYKHSHMVSLGIPIYIKYRNFCGALSLYLYSEDFDFSDTFLLLLSVKNIEILMEGTNL